MSMGARPPTKMAARVQSHIDRRNGFSGGSQRPIGYALPMRGCDEALSGIRSVGRRGPSPGSRPGCASAPRIPQRGSIPVGAAGDQQHRVATALYEDLAQIVAMVHDDPRLVDEAV